MSLFNYLIQNVEILNEDTILIKKNNTNLNKNVKIMIGDSDHHKNRARYKFSDNAKTNYTKYKEYIEYKFDSEGNPEVVDNSDKNIKNKELKQYGIDFGRRYYPLLDYNAKHNQELNRNQLKDLIEQDLISNNYTIPNNERVYYNNKTKSIEVRKEN